MLDEKSGNWVGHKSLVTDYRLRENAEDVMNPVSTKFKLQI